MADKKHTILLVEDEATVATVLASALEQSGYSVLIAGDGAAGLKMALEQHPDVILADIILPVMSGLEMIREIRKDSWGAKAEIMVLTNVSDNATLEAALSQDALYYIVKGDSSMDDIIAKVRLRILAQEKKSAHEKTVT